MSARDDVLAAIRAALAPNRDRGGHADRRGSHGGDGTASVDLPVGAAGAPSVDRAAMLEMFAERVADYRATVTRCAPADLAGAITSACTARDPSSYRPGWHWTPTVPLLSTTG